MLEAADPDEGPWPIHGVAVAAGDVLHDQSGNPVLITAEELAKAEYAPASKKLTIDHPDYEGVSPPVEATVGNNSMSYSPDGEAVVYDATTHNDEIAAGVNGQTYDVSISAGFRPGEPDPETGLPVAKDIVFHDLSVVSIGDSPSNSAQYGGRSDVAAWARSGGLEAAISEQSVEANPDDFPDPDDEAVGFLRGLANRWGFSLTADAEQEQEQDDSRSGESGRGATSDTMTDREDHIRYLTANADYDEDDFEGMSDDAVAQTRDLVASDDGEDEETETNNQTDETPELNDDLVAQLTDALQDQGFVTADELEATRKADSQSEQVDEIIAASEDYGEDDREELMASSPAVVEKIHRSEAAPGAAPIPGVGGPREQVRASLGDEHDLDDFGTGVSE